MINTTLLFVVQFSAVFLLLAVAGYMLIVLRQKTRVSTAASTQFVGFALLEEMIDQCTKRMPIYVMSATEPGQPNKMNLRIDRAVLSIWQPNARRPHMIHYCNLFFGYIESMGPNLLNAEKRMRILKNQQDAEGFVTDWLHEHGFNKIVPGLIDRPNDDRGLDGWAGFLAYRDAPDGNGRELYRKDLLQ